MRVGVSDLALEPLGEPLGQPDLERLIDVRADGVDESDCSGDPILGLGLAGGSAADLTVIQVVHGEAVNQVSSHPAGLRGPSTLEFLLECDVIGLHVAANEVLGLDEEVSVPGAAGELTVRNGRYRQNRNAVGDGAPGV